MEVIGDGFEVRGCRFKQINRANIWDRGSWLGYMSARGVSKWVCDPGNWEGYGQMKCDPECSKVRKTQDRADYIATKILFSMLVSYPWGSARYKLGRKKVATGFHTS